jgi:hypothetical protein
MNELHVTLEALDLTSDERMELNSALALMNSVEGAKVTTTAIL